MIALTLAYFSRRMMIERVIEADDDHIAAELATWAAFDDETRPEALLILGHAIILRQQRLVIERQEIFAKLCKKARNDNSLQLYKKKEDARRALDRSRQIPPGVPDDCPIVIVDGVIEILVDGDSEDGDREEESNNPQTLSEIEQDDAGGQSQEAANSLDKAVAAAADPLDEDVAAAANSLDALASLPSPLLPSPDLPSPTLNSRSQPARCRSFDRACRYAYGPARLEGQTDGEGVEDSWRRMRRGPAEEHEFRAGFARGLARAWEVALAEPSAEGSTEEEWAHLTGLLAPNRRRATTQTSGNGNLPSTSEVASGDLTLDEIAEVEDAWTRVLTAARRNLDDQNQVAALLLEDDDDDDGGTSFCIALDLRIP
ncbi:hypothetical protein C8R47DRAFT_1230261 [Mycena vitilis]|nr:hypothetical protein C8R47DRAFT_1230261 [Mycena vitilis]